MAAMENQNRVVMGFPPNFFETASRYEEPAIVNTSQEPSPCNNSVKNPHPLLKWLILTVIVLFMLFFLLAFAVVCLLNYQNRAPIIAIESINPSKIATIKNTSMIEFNWHLTLFFENPNRFSSIDYKNVRVSVFDRLDKRLCSSYVDDFYQGKGELGRMKMEINGLVLDLAKDKKNEGGEMVVSLKLDAVVWVETKFISSSSHWQLLEANCGDVIVRPSMSLNLDGSGQCHVDLQ